MSQKKKLPSPEKLRKMHWNERHKYHDLETQAYLDRRAAWAKKASAECSNVFLQKIATEIHYRNCYYNHTDGCGFGYDNWTDRITEERVRLYKLAQRLCKQQKTSPEQFVRRIQIAEKVYSLLRQVFAEDSEER